MNILIFISAIMMGIKALAITDVHVHTYEGKIANSPGHVDHIIESMNEAGIDKAFLLSYGYFVPSSDTSRTKIENDHVASLVKTHPDRFYGFCSVHILDEGASKEIKRCAQLGLKGLKLHPLAQGTTFPGYWPVDLTNSEHLEKLRSIFSIALTENLIVIMDSGFYSEMAAINVFRLHQQFPKLRLILAHSLSTNFRLMNFIKWVYSFYPANITRYLYVDISTDLDRYQNDPEKDLWMATLRNFGMEYVLYGSDYPYFRPAKEVERIRNNFTSKESEQILSKNVETFLSLPEANSSPQFYLSDELWESAIATWDFVQCQAMQQDSF